MKKYLPFLCLILAVSCTKSIENTAGAHTVSFTAETPMPKASFGKIDQGKYPTLWTNSDKTLKMSLNGKEPLDAAITASADGKTAAFSASFDNPGSAPYIFYALSPSSAFKSISSSSWSYTIPSIQTPSASSPDEKALIISATSETYQKMPDQVSMKFKHLCAYGKISLKNLNLGEGKVQSVVLTSDVAFVSDSKTLKINTSATSDIWFACSPVDMAGHTLTINAVTSVGCFIRSITMPSTATFKTGVVATFSINMAGIDPIVQYELLTDISSLDDGDQVLIATRTKSAVAGDITSDNYLESISCSFEDDDKTVIGELPEGAVEFTANKSGSYWTFSNPDGKLLGCTSAKKLAWGSGETSWTVSISGSGSSVAATITSKTSAYGRLQYNSSSPRFNTYTSSQTAIQLYRKSISSPTEPKKLVMSTVSCTGITASSLTFSWAAVTGAVSYMVSVDDASYISQTSTTCNLTSLKESSTHTVCVYAVGDGVKYLDSDPASCSATTSSQGGGGSKACRGWFELPAQTDKDNNGIDDNNPDYYYSWTLRADAPTIRNFSACYSKSMIHPVWVAAPMHSSYKGSSGRNDSYKDDPNIHCTQSAKFNGYTRGHMVGSAERTVSVATNKQAFYYSNIGAQTQTGFNTGGGAWNNLESFVEGQWCSDTLYTVIGCIFETFTDKNGSTVNKKTGTNGAGDTFQVPTAYYKVLLRTKKGNTGKRVDQCSADELKAVGLILLHKSNAGHKPDTKDLYSVADIEKLTGLTFFVNVPNAPKTTYSASDWGL